MQPIRFDLIWNIKHSRLQIRAPQAATLTDWLTTNHLDPLYLTLTLPFQMLRASVCLGKLRRVRLRNRPLMLPRLMERREPWKIWPAPSRATTKHPSAPPLAGWTASMAWSWRRRPSKTHTHTHTRTEQQVKIAGWQLMHCPCVCVHQECHQWHHRGGDDLRWHPAGPGLPHLIPTVKTLPCFPLCPQRPQNAFVRRASQLWAPTLSSWSLWSASPDLQPSVTSPWSLCRLKYSIILCQHFTFQSFIRRSYPERFTISAFIFR